MKITYSKKRCQFKKIELGKNFVQKIGIGFFIYLFIGKTKKKKKNRKQYYIDGSFLLFNQMRM
jgi:hypothetical protein